MTNEQIAVEEKISKDQAVLSIGILRDECAVMGANDFEVKALIDLMEKVKSGEKDPNIAFQEATLIRAGKMECR